MKIGDKIRSDKYPKTPNGNIFTVVQVYGCGAVNATCDSGTKGEHDSYQWHFFKNQYTPHTPTTGTLQELNVKAGDVVECVDDRSYGVYTTGKQYECPKDGWAYDNFKTSSNESSCCESYSRFKIISRANETPRTWGELTDAEKGALLLADHEGGVIQSSKDGIKWVGFLFFGDNFYYRIKPEPVVETVTAYAQPELGGGFEVNSHCDHWRYTITFDTIDGIPDTSSIRMVDNG